MKLSSCRLLRLLPAKIGSERPAGGRLFVFSCFFVRDWSEQVWQKASESRTGEVYHESPSCRSEARGSDRFSLSPGLHSLGRLFAKRTPRPKAGGGPDDGAAPCAPVTR